MGPQPTATLGRDVLDRGPARLPGFAGAGSVLVDGSGGDFFRFIFAGSALLEALLDVVVLALSFGAPGSLWHGHRPPVGSVFCLSDRPPAKQGSLTSPERSPIMKPIS